MKISTLPKLELHCHLDGSLPLRTVQELLDDKTITIQQLQVEPDCRNLAEYLSKFALPIRCIQTKEGLQRCAYDLIEEVAKENTCYIEVRFAPMLSVNAQLTCRDVIEAVDQGLKRGYQDFGVYANVIVCGMRHHSFEQNKKMLYIAREMLGHGVCAYDLAGDEAAFANADFYDLFKEVKRIEMPFTIHSGECHSVENVRAAMEMGAKRIGHGIALAKDSKLMKEYAKKRIGLEMCPTSNLQTKAVDSWAEYPFETFWDAGVLVTINTDNRTVSGTTGTKELEMIYNHYGQNQDMICQLQHNAVEIAFASADIKHGLLKKLKSI